MSHTPGPWIYYFNALSHRAGASCYSLVSLKLKPLAVYEGIWIADIFAGRKEDGAVLRPEAAANAHLIAAAPDLLAVCETLLDWADKSGAEGEIIPALRAAVTKAKGLAP